MEKSRLIKIVFALIFAALAAVCCVLGCFLRGAAFADGDAELMMERAAAYVAAHDFTAKSEGHIKAKVFGVPYNVGVDSIRSVKGGELFQKAESVSAFAKAGLIREYRGGKYYVTVGEHKRRAFRYGEAKEFSEPDYIAAYGKPALSLTRYEPIVLASRREGDLYIYTLDPVRATEFSRNEAITTLGGAAVEYESVELRLALDGDKPLSVSAREVFTVDKFGGTKCVAEFTETFDFG